MRRHLTQLLVLLALALPAAASADPYTAPGDEVLRGGQGGYTAGSIGAFARQSGKHPAATAGRPAVGAALVRQPLRSRGTTVVRQFFGFLKSHPRVRMAVYYQSASLKPEFALSTHPATRAALRRAVKWPRPTGVAP